MCGIYYNPNANRAIIRNAAKENVKERKRNRVVLNMVQYMSDTLPSSYFDWEKTQFDRIMFCRKVAPKVNVGYCECGAVVALSSIKSGRMIQCPECKHSVRVTKTLNEYWAQEAYTAYIYSADGGWIQRLFVVEKETELQDNTVHTRITRFEEERDYTDGSSIRFYHPVWGDNDRWIAGPGRMHGQGWCGWRICDKPLRTFPHNLSELFKGSKYQYSALDIAAKHAFVNPFHYLFKYDSEPRLEMVFKLGLYRVGQQLLSDGYEIRDVKQLFRNIKSVKDLGIYGKADLEECKNLTLQEIIARKEVKKWNITKEEPSLAIAFVAKVNDRCGADFGYSFISRKQWFKYFTQQKEYTDVRNFISDYTDYISDCSALKYDLSDPQVIMPKRLTAAHERSITARKHLEAQNLKKNFCLQVQKWLKASYTDKNFAIAVIPNPDALIKEAKAMRNCSAGYADRIAKGNCSIWTIRRSAAPDTAFYMLELSKNGEVIQCRGVANGGGYCGQPPATPEVQAFVNKWLKRKVSPIIKQIQEQHAEAV